MNNTDSISYHGIITSIRDNIDSKYIWFDICKYENYVDKDGIPKTNPSFFSARIYKQTKYALKLNDEVYVKGIPKGYVDKKGYRQNYIHVNEINNSSIHEDILDKTISYDTDGVMLWHGKRCESIPASRDEQGEMEQLIKEIAGDENE